MRTRLRSYNGGVGSKASSVAFAVCLSILVGSFGVALGRRYCGGESVVLAGIRSESSLTIANAGPLTAVSTAASDVALVRDAVAITPTHDLASASTIAALEAEVARLRSELGTTRFASMLVAAAPADQPLGFAHAMLLLDRSYLTVQPECARCSPRKSGRKPRSTCSGLSPHFARLSWRRAGPAATSGRPDAIVRPGPRPAPRRCRTLRPNDRALPSDTC